MISNNNNKNNNENTKQSIDMPLFYWSSSSYSTLNVSGKSSPDRGQPLTMSAPGGVEFHNPSRLTTDDELCEVGGVELGDRFIPVIECNHGGQAARHADQQQHGAQCQTHSKVKIILIESNIYVK